MRIGFLIAAPLLLVGCLRPGDRCTAPIVAVEDMEGVEGNRTMTQSVVISVSHGPFMLVSLSFKVSNATGYALSGSFEDVDTNRGSYGHGPPGVWYFDNQPPSDTINVADALVVLSPPKNAERTNVFSHLLIQRGNDDVGGTLNCV